MKDGVIGHSHADLLCSLALHTICRTQVKPKWVLTFLLWVWKQEPLVFMALINSQNKTVSLSILWSDFSNVG